MRFRPIAFALSIPCALAASACSSTTVDCKATACPTGTLTYQTCGNLDTTETFKFNGTDCQCSGADPSSCSSCQTKINAYCASTSDMSTTPGACSLVGTFTQTPTGTEVVFTGTATSGTYVTTIATDQSAITLDGNFTQTGDGDGATLVNTSAMPSGIEGCIGESASYTLAWSNSCGTVVFTKLSDQCSGRAGDVNGETLTRQ